MMLAWLVGFKMAHDKIYLSQYIDIYNGTFIKKQLVSANYVYTELKKIGALL